MKLKRYIALLLTLILCAGLFAGCGKQSGGGENEFTWWLGNTASTEYYVSYEDNPVIKYVMENKTFENSSGEQANVKLTFQTPPANKEAENFNTLLTTGGYSDVISLTFYSGTTSDLYEEGIILDLTDYVAQYMPNLSRYLEENPEYGKYFYTDTSEGRKLLTLPTMADELSLNDQFSGWCYRRDWIVKYGVQPDSFLDPMNGERKVNPNAGKAFSGYYSLDTDGNEVHHDTLQADTNGDSWVDDVVFPSGNPDPLYISDWEWMFEIFQKAINEQQIADGYVLSIYYPGYNANGDLVTAFGGGGPLWYQADGKAYFGATSDNFKTYLQCLNNWWNKGWIDQRFSERSSDMFYQIDDAGVRQGKVGLWLGSASTLDSRIQNAQQPYTDGAVVYGAAQPINDIYGADAQKLKTPTCMFQNELLGGGIAITEKAKDKDIGLLCRFIDYFYSEEGSILRTYGLGAEEMAVCQNETYMKYGLENGAFTYAEENGEKLLVWDPIMTANDGNVQNALSARKFTGMFNNSILKESMTPTHQNSREQWIRYTASGWFGGMFNSQMRAEEMDEQSKVRVRIEQEYMYISVPQFIKGEKNFDEDWESFCKDLRKRGCDEITELYDGVIQRIQ